jgi:hypothetical protein
MGDDRMSTRYDDEHNYEVALRRIIAERLLPPHALDDPQRSARALELLREGYTALPASRRGALRKASKTPGRPPPDWLVELLRRTLGSTALHRWAKAHEPALLESLGPAAKLEVWLADRRFNPSPELLGAALRAALGIASDQDTALIDAQLGPLLRRYAMTPINFDFDPRSRPAAFDDVAQGRLVAIVLQQLDHTVPDDRRQVMLDTILGALSIDGFLTQDVQSQIRHITKLRFDAEGTTQPVSGTDPIPNRDAYQKVSDAILAIRAGSGDPLAYYEELTFVARELISNAAVIPIDANGLRERVAETLNDYVPGQSGGSLTLPPLSEQDGVASDLVADNIRAVALIYAAWNLEELKLIPVLDRVTEVFFNGQLPIGFDNGGRALAEYYFQDQDQRLSEAARRMTYSRVLGVPGGQTSKEAPPNKAFNDLFLRFLSSVSEYDRQRRIADVVGTRPRTDVLSVTAESVRTAGFNFAKVATLVGYAGTFFVAQRLEAQIKQALRILSTAEILAAYGVPGPFQLIERVCASDFGGQVPNIVRHRTMAEAGKEIIDIVAAFVPAWLGQTGNELFTDPFATPIFNTGTSPLPTPRPADIPPEVEARLMRAVEQWLTVNGIKDDVRARYGEPEMTTSSPSIPNIAQDGSSATFDQLRQLVSAGQVPSLDQLKALLPDGAGMVRA